MGVTRVIGVSLYAYDNNGWLTEECKYQYQNNQRCLTNYKYTYDNNGNRLASIVSVACQIGCYSITLDSTFGYWRNVLTKGK